LDNKEELLTAMKEEFKKFAKIDINSIQADININKKFKIVFIIHR